LDTRNVGLHLPAVSKRLCCAWSCVKGRCPKGILRWVRPTRSGSTSRPTNSRVALDQTGTALSRIRRSSALVSPCLWAPL
jgi:hypothetical protein